MYGKVAYFQLKMIVDNHFATLVCHKVSQMYTLYVTGTFLHLHPGHICFYLYNL